MVAAWTLDAFKAFWIATSPFCEAPLTSRSRLLSVTLAANARLGLAALRLARIASALCVVRWTEVVRNATLSPSATTLAKNGA